MILREFASLIILIVIAILATTASVSTYLWGPDNDYEQAVEHDLKTHYDIDIDFSPGNI